MGNLYIPKTLDDAIKEIRRLERINDERYKIEKALIAAGLLEEDQVDKARELVRSTTDATRG